MAISERSKIATKSPLRCQTTRHLWIAPKFLVRILSEKQLVSSGGGGSSFLVFCAVPLLHGKWSLFYSDSRTLAFANAG